MTTRVLVTGSRLWTTPADIYKALDEYLAADPNLIVVHGACRTGADAHADAWCRRMSVAVERHPARWRPHGIYNPQAGLVRNRAMVELGADVCLSFIRDGSRGASHCARLAEEAGIPVRRFTA